MTDAIRSRISGSGNLAIASLALVLALLCWNPRLSLSGDNAEYILLARSLAQGDGMSIMGEVSQKFPPGFPALLVPFEWAFPGDWIWMKIPALLAFVGLVWIVARLGSPWAAILVGTSPLLLEYAHQVMADMPFALAVTAGLLLCTRDRLWWAGLLVLVGAYYLKTVGAVFLGCALVEMYLSRCGPSIPKKQYRRLAYGGLFCAVLLAPWIVRDLMVVGGNFYLTQFTLLNPYYPEQGIIPVAGLVQRFLENSAFYLAQYPVIWVLLAIGAYYSWQQGRHRLLWLALGSYMGVILLWYWNGERFLVPVMPLVLVLSGYGLYNLWEREFNRRRVWALPLIGVALVVQLHDVYGLALDKDYPPEWQNYATAGEGLRDHTQPDVVICARKPCWLSVVSGRRVVSFPFKEPDQVWDWWEEHRVDYVVVEQLGSMATQRHLIPALKKYQEFFELVGVSAQGPLTSVFRRRPLGGT